MRWILLTKLFSPPSFTCLLYYPTFLHLTLRTMNRNMPLRGIQRQVPGLRHWTDRPQGGTRPRTMAVSQRTGSDGYEDQGQYGRARRKEEKVLHAAQPAAGEGFVWQISARVRRGAEGEHAGKLQSTQRRDPAPSSHHRASDAASSDSSAERSLWQGEGENRREKIHHAEQNGLPALLSWRVLPLQTLPPGVFLFRRREVPTQVRLRSSL